MTEPGDVENAAKRIKKYPESRKSARDSQIWIDFLDSIGVHPNAYSSDKGSNFWNEVRDTVNHNAGRREQYSMARSIGKSSKEARQVRDWSEEKFNIWYQFEKRKNI